MHATHVDGRFTPEGLRPTHARTLLAGLLAYAEQPRTVDELTAWPADRLDGLSERAVWPVLRAYAPLLRVPTGGPWSFTQQTAYVAAQPQPALDTVQVAATALQQLVRRYLAGFGPASVKDIAQFALVQQYRVKAALRSLGDAVVQLSGGEGPALFDLVDAPLRPVVVRPAGEPGARARRGVTRLATVSVQVSLLHGTSRHRRARFRRTLTNRSAPGPRSHRDVGVAGRSQWPPTTEIGRSDDGVTPGRKRSRSRSPTKARRWPRNCSTTTSVLPATTDRRPSPDPERPADSAGLTR